MCVPTQALEAWESFRAHNLPAVVFSDVSLFSSKEAREILWVLEGLIECGMNDLLPSTTTGLLGVSASDFIKWKEDISSWEAG